MSSRGASSAMGNPLGWGRRRNSILYERLRGAGLGKGGISGACYTPLVTGRARWSLAAALVAAGLAAWILLRPGPTGVAPPPAAGSAAPAQHPAGGRLPPPVEGTAGGADPGAPAPVPASPADQEEGKPTLLIHGRVVDPSGLGVPGATVELRAWSGKDPDTIWTTLRGITKDGGSFEFSLQRDLASSGFGLETAAAGFLEGWRAVKPGEYDPSEGIDVVVEKARAVVGCVVDEYGRGIAGTVVQLWYGSETTWPTKVDAAGAFRTPAAGPRRAFELIVEAPGYPRRTIPLAAADEEATDVGAIAFRRGGRVAGVVVDSQDRPV